MEIAQETAVQPVASKKEYMEISLVQKYLCESMVSYLVEKSPQQTKEETIQQTEECLRFLYLSHFTRGGIPVSQKVDNIWHLLILETQDYLALCEKLPAKSFIHHRSDALTQFKKKFQEETSEILEPPAQEAKRHLEWLVSYVKNFGPFTEKNIQHWSFAQALRLKFQFNLEQFNQQLQALS